MAKVLVTGIAAVDFLFQVNEMPTEPIKHRASAMETVGGGIAANAAVAIARLGGQAHLMTRLGDDQIGRMIRDGLEAENVDLSATVTTLGARSPVSTVVLDAAGERMLVNFPGCDLAETANPPADFDAVLVDTRWPAAALLTLAAARNAGKPGVLDAEAPVPRNLVNLASHIVFSAQGLRDFTGLSDLEAALLSLPSRAWVGVTDGARGIAIRVEDGVTWVPGYAVGVVDTLGAGDVWHGAFAMALGEGQSEIEAVTFAHAVAALKCTDFGGRSATPSREQVIQFMKENT